MSAIHCFFCGGKECKYENWRLWDTDKYEGKNAIDGLYCNWITDKILAMQRPSTRLMREYNLVAKFQELGIGSIFNLQEAGEHASCGDGNEPSSGFSYLPETWMDNGIFFYNFGWPDMDIPDNETMMNLVQVMAYALSNGKKFAVHCHAGLGRTGLSIACYLVYGENIQADTAILQVRAKRPLSVQTKKQVQFVSRFEEYLRGLRLVFPGWKTKSQLEQQPTESMSLQAILDNQRRYLHGVEQRNLRSVPKLVYRVCGRLLTLCSEQTSEAGDRIHDMISSFVAYEGIKKLDRKSIAFQIDINEGHWGVVDNVSDVPFLVHLLLYWITSLKDPLLSNKAIELLEASQSDYKAAIQTLDRDTFQTINYFLSLFRKLPAVSKSTLDQVFEHLAVIFTSHRSTIEHPYVHWTRAPPTLQKSGSKDSIVVKPLPSGPARRALADAGAMLRKNTSMLGKFASTTLTSPPAPAPAPAQAPTQAPASQSGIADPSLQSLAFAGPIVQSVMDATTGQPPADPSHPDESRSAADEYVQDNQLATIFSEVVSQQAGDIVCEQQPTFIRDNAFETDEQAARMSRDVLADASGSHQEGSLALASAPPVQPSAAPAATIPASAIPSAVAVSASHPTTTSVQFVQANDEEPAASLVTVVAFLRYVYRAYTCADETRAVSTESFSFVHEPSPVLNPAEYVTQDSYSSRINLAKALASKKDPSGDADKEQAGPLASSTIQNAANMISSALRGGMAKRDASASSSPNIMNPQQQDASRVGTAVGSESASNISSGQPTTGAIASSIVSGAVKNMSSGVKSMSSGVRNMSSGLRSVFVSRANTYDALQPGDEPSPLTSPRSPQANVQDTEAQGEAGPRYRASSAKAQVNQLFKESIAGLKRAIEVPLSAAATAIPHSLTSSSSSPGIKGPASGNTPSLPIQDAATVPIALPGGPALVRIESEEFKAISAFLDQHSCRFDKAQQDRLKSLCQEHDQVLAAVYSTYGEAGTSESVDQFVSSCNMMFCGN